MFEKCSKIISDYLIDNGMIAKNAIITANSYCDQAQSEGILSEEWAKKQCLKL